MRSAEELDEPQVIQIIAARKILPVHFSLLTGLLADGSWVPMAAVHFVAITAALLAGWMAV